MTDETKIHFDEPKTFTLSKFKLGVSLVMILWVVGIMIFGNKSYPVSCYAPVTLFAIYLFLPFMYKLIVSNAAISSINLLGMRTLEWNEVEEMGIKNGNLILSNRDGDVKVTVNQQIDDYPNVIKFIKQQRPELWRLDDINSFHQGYVESVLSFFMGLASLLGGILVVFGGDSTTNKAIPILLLFGISVIFILSGLLRIRKLILGDEILVVQYLFWNRQFHIKDVWSVSLEPKFGKNVVAYEVHIRIRNKNDVVIEKAKEGNPILVNAIETWMKRYKSKQNDRT